MKTIRKLILISTGIILVIIHANAQIFPSELALTFSRTYQGGSARILGLGGVNTSLGGDITSVSTNPAGLGFYNRSEISLTPVINFNTNTSSYLGSSGNTSLTRFNMGNLGVVVNNTKSDQVPGGWKGGSFGFSFNRINDFNNEIFYSGTNVENDYIDYLLNFADANDAELGDFYTLDMGYYTFLLNDFSIDQDTGDTLAMWDSFVEFPTEDSPVRQSERIITSGSQNKWDLSYGGNFNDRFYFGLGLGIVTVSYENEKYYSEQRYPESILNNYTLYERQIVDGVGVNANLGIIVRPINTLTVGINYTTPTAYSFTDEYETSMHTVWNASADEFYGDDPNFEGDHLEETFLDPLIYTISTPMRLNAGISYFFNKSGFISGDIEWVDYSRAKVRSNDVDFSVDNQEISGMYRSVINYRLGGEYRMGIFRIRAGFNYQSDPRAGQSDMLLAVQTYSAGIGLRKKSFYTDFAYLYSTTEGTRAPYIIDPAQEIGPTPVADINYAQNRLVFTVGFMF
ncbi:MAG: outer membrane protein transport protein [Cyclobacteriaceae bacterium]|nr:outer membrane protein transport protein [Cyclobacteriaceae bacterium]